MGAFACEIDELMQLCVYTIVLISFATIYVFLPDFLI